MEIINASSTESAVFYIGTGEQVTLVARGLAGNDVVNIEILDIEDDIQKVGNPCCPLHPVNLKITNVMPLACQNGRTMKLTALKPFCVIDSPQNTPLRVSVDADPAAFVTVDLEKTDGTVCESCGCECVDEVWTATGQTRCEGDMNQNQEVSNCGTLRWVDTTPITWVETGEFKCEDGKVVKQEVNDCGVLRWTPGADQVWVETGETKCEGTNFFKQEVNECGHLRWTDTGAQTWVEDGETRCTNNVVEKKELNNCGIARWTATTETCYCPSYPLLDGGYGYVDGDAKDPEATVAIAPCVAGQAPTVYVYPTPAKGRTAEQRDCDGVIIGYGMNQSPCAINKNNNAVTNCGTCNC